MEKRGCLWPPAVRSIPSVCPPSPPGRSPFWQIIQGTGGWQANPQKWRLSERSTISRFEKRKYFEKSSRKLTQVAKSVCGSIFQYLNSSPHLHFAPFNHSCCTWIPSQALHCTNQGAHIYVHCSDPPYSTDNEQVYSEMG